MTEARNTKYFNMLHAIAECNEPVRGFRHSSALIIGNQIVSVGRNKLKSHPLQKQFGKNDKCIFLHSEVDCIINALRHVEVDDLNRATLYILRLNNRGQRGNSAPCSGCLKAIIHFGIKNVVTT